jgi:polar amino acid transport system substrate-binding protein
MTERATVEEQIARWFIEEAAVEAPDRVLHKTVTATHQITQVRRRVLPFDSSRRRMTLLLAATLLVAGAGIGAAGALLYRAAPDLLTRVTSAGVVAVAVRPDHPQVVGTTVGLDGFDIDVARALGSQLGLSVDVRPVPVTDMLAQQGNTGADLFLPSLGTAAIDPARFAHSVPYYWWPHYLLVTVASGRNGLADLAGQQICAVDGDAGKAWLDGQAGVRPIDRSTAVTLTSDAECLAALTSGQVAAMVTAQMGPADLAARPNLTSIPGPPSEPRGVIAPLASQPGSLMAAVDAALGSMLGDGTLTQLSQNRFGGYDLTSPPAE